MNIIPAILAPTRTNGGLRSKTALRAALRLNPGPGEGAVEFISQSMFHRSGSWFTVAEAVEVYGPISVEVRHGSDVFAVIEADTQRELAAAPQGATGPELMHVHLAVVVR